jgi:hypothetical protein
MLLLLPSALVGNCFTPEFFIFEPFFRKIFTSRLLDVLFSFLDPELGAVMHGAEVTRLGTMTYDAEV